MLYRFWINLDWVNDDKIFFFVGTISLTVYYERFPHPETQTLVNVRLVFTPTFAQRHTSLFSSSQCSLYPCTLSLLPCCLSWSYLCFSIFTPSFLTVLSLFSLFSQCDYGWSKSGDIYPARISQCPVKVLSMDWVSILPEPTPSCIDRCFSILLIRYTASNRKRDTFRKRKRKATE